MNNDNAPKISSPPEWDRILSAAQKNNADMIERLVKTEGVSSSHANYVGQSALHIAALWGNVEALKALIELSASLSPPNQITGGTPLHCAAQSGKQPESNRLECVRLLLDAGADPSASDFNGSFPSDYAEEGGEMSKLLSEAMPKSELMEFLKQKEASGVEEYLKQGGDVSIKDKDGNGPVMIVLNYMMTEADGCADDSYLEILKMLLESKGTDTSIPNSEGETPFHVICTSLSQMYASSSKIQDMRIPFFERAARIFLGDSGLTIREETRQLLHDACRRNNVNMILFLLNVVTVDVDMKGRQGMTPLHFAARSGKADAVAILLKNKANKELLDDRGKEAVHYARVNEKDEVVALLVG